MGGNDQFNTAIDTKRPFYWSSSGKSIAYSNWYQGEPNNEKNQEHCVQTFAYSPNFQWNDVSCSNQYGFICEEEQSRSDYLQALEERRQHVLNAMKKINELMQREQEKVQEMVQSVRSLIAKNKNDVEKYVEAIFNRSSHDSQENEVTPVSGDTNDQISELNERLQALTSKISNKLSEKLEEVKQTIEQVVKNNSL